MFFNNILPMIYEKHCWKIVGQLTHSFFGTKPEYKLQIIVIGQLQIIWHLNLYKKTISFGRNTKMIIFL